MQRRGFIKQSLAMIVTALLGPRLSVAAQSAELCTPDETRERAFTLTLNDTLQTLPTVYVPKNSTVSITLNNETSGSVRLCWPDGSQSLSLSAGETATFQFLASRTRRKFYCAYVKRNKKIQTLKGAWMLGSSVAPS